MRRAVRQARAAVCLLGAGMRRLHAPLKLNLCVTYRCQSRCRTCNIWQRRPSGELSTEELLRFVSANRSFAWLDVIGGEVFLRDDLPEVFDAIAATWTKLALFHFATNGLLTERIVRVTERLAARTPAQVIVTVSLDGDEALNDEIRGVPGGYRRQIATFNALRRLPRVRTVFGMTLSGHNLGRVAETLAACQAACPGVGADDLHLNVAQRSAHFYGNADGDWPQASPGELRAALLRHRHSRRWPTTPTEWVESAYLRGLDRFLACGSTPARCHALRSSCFVDPWGTVFPCIGYPRPLGRLRDTDLALEPIWLGPESVAAQKEIWEGRCPQCWTACEAYQSILGNLLRFEAPRPAVSEPGSGIRRNQWTSTTTTPPS